MTKLPLMNQRVLSLLLMWSCLMVAPLAGQNFERLNPEVKINGQTLDNPFTGGLNLPQFSAVDLNNDEILDLYIFDRLGDLHLTFINEGTPNEPSYRYDPEYQGNFPTCVNWVLLRDFDEDGAMDIFTHFESPVQGISVYKGYFDEDDKLAFEQFNFYNGNHNIIYYQLTNGSYTQIYVSPLDYPVVDDIDNDGDMDIVTFSIGGSYAEYFQNRSVENGWGKDRLDLPPG